MLIRKAQYMQETWGSHHVLKRGGPLQRVKNDLKIYFCKTITNERLLGSLMLSGCLQEVPTIGL